MYFYIILQRPGVGLFFLSQASATSLSMSSVSQASTSTRHTPTYCPPRSLNSNQPTNRTSRHPHFSHDNHNHKPQPKTREKKKKKNANTNTHLSPCHPPSSASSLNAPSHAPFPPFPFTSAPTHPPPPPPLPSNQAPRHPASPPSNKPNSNASNAP